MFIQIPEIDRSRKWRRRKQRSFLSRKFNTPPDPTSPPAAASPTSPPPAATPSPTPTSPPPAASTPAAVPGTSGSPTPGATPASSAPATPASAMSPPPTPAPLSFDQEFSRRYGMEPGQAQLLLQLGYQTYRDRQQPAPAQQPASPPAPANIFGLPEFDYRLLDFVAKDPNTGQMQLLPGAPPDALLRIQNFQSQLRDVQQKFFQDPMQFLGKAIEERVQAIARETYGKQFGQHQAQTDAQRIVNENADWLFAKDATGQRQMQFNPATGQMAPVLSDWGRYYQQCASQVAAQGLQDPNVIHAHAMNMVKVAAFEAQRQQQAPAGGTPSADPAAAAFLQQRANQQPGPAAPVQTPPPPPVPSVTTPQTLKERMRLAFEQNGITDSVVNQQINRVHA